MKNDSFANVLSKNELSGKVFFVGFFKHTNFPSGNVLKLTGNVYYS